MLEEFLHFLGRALKANDEGLQILGEFILVNNEGGGLHALFYLGALQMGQIVRGILHHGLEIMLKILPALVDFLIRKSLFREKEAFQGLEDTVKLGGFQRTAKLFAYMAQLLQHALDFYSIGAALIAEPLFLEVGNGLGAACFLMGDEVFPPHQGRQILLQLLEGIIPEVGIFLQLVKNVLGVHIGLHVLMPLEAEMQDGPVSPGVVCI